MVDWPSSNGFTNSLLLLQLLPPIPMTRKVEIQRQHASLKRTPESPLPTLIPLPINNLKRNILIRRSGTKPQYTKVIPIRTFQEVLWRLRLIDKIGIKDVEFIPLYNLGRGVVMVEMCPVVCVPIVTRLDTVKVSWFAWTVLILPGIIELLCRSIGIHNTEINLIIKTQFFLEIAKVGLYALAQTCVVLILCHTLP